MTNPAHGLRAVVALATILVTRTLAAEDVGPSLAATHEEHDVVPVITTVQVSVPQLQLVRADGKPVSLAAEVDDGRPVVVNFIFTTCGSICPLMSQVFGQFQSQLGADSNRVHLISISTDPEEDSPSKLRAYAQQFGARPGWDHYTGTLEASQTAQRAFGVYRGDKMSHTPVTLIRAAPGESWTRIDGFVTPQELMQDYRKVVASR
jgi:protein SCO1/2